LLAVIRLVVVVYEEVFVWRGRYRDLRTLLRFSKTYQDWKSNAATLDALMSHDAWKTRNSSEQIYDPHLIRKTTRKLARGRRGGDVAELSRQLLNACKGNHGGYQNEALYSNSNVGTKVDVERLQEEVAASIRFLRNSPDVDADEKTAIFKTMSHNYGRTGLALSGGGSITYYHFGVLKALWKEGLLPDVISGSSGGSLIAALICTRTDQEMKDDCIFDPSVVHQILTIMADPWIVRLKRFFNEGYLFHPAIPFKKLDNMTKGHLTFLEAYHKTGRILCITVSPDEPNSTKPPKVLNYLTAPDVIISSAICASCALPGILPSGNLLSKTSDGRFVPFQGAGKKWRDGSIRHDIPDLNSLNVTFTIVSQVNFHITPFFFQNRGSAGSPVAHRGGRGWRGGFILSALNEFLMLDLMKWLRLCKSMRLIPPVGQTDISEVFIQNTQFQGTVTILPSVRFVPYDLIHVLEDPDEKMLQHYMARGELETWPKIAMIRDRMRVERLLDPSIK
ncbi:acyl transferase/acyl hydrolase/lysophospholipase, partial [Chytriomyces sp. MP71]